MKYILLLGSPTAIISIITTEDGSVWLASRRPRTSHHDRLQCLQALKDIGGASDDYQEIVAFLYSLAITLDALRTFDGVLASPGDVASIRAQVDLVQEPVQKFTKKIESKFEPNLGTQVTKGVRKAVRGWHRKAQWALWVSEEAKALGEKIAIPLCAIQIKVGLQALLVVSDMRNSLPLEVCNKVTEAVANTIPDLLDYAINPLRQTAERQTHEYMVNNTLLERKMDEISQRVHQDINTAFQTLSKNAGELKTVGAAITNLLEIHNKTRNGITSAGRQAARQNVWAEAGRHFGHLCKLAMALHELFSQLWPILAPYFLYLRVFKSAISRMPSLLLENNILFVDVLGRTRSLPYIYYRNWDTFECFLRKDFEKIPGERQILEGRYHITDRRGQIIQSSRWQDFAVAKAQLSMAIILAISTTAGRCPRCQTSAASAIRGEKIIWCVALYS
ncbi:hypothetical protein BGZ57DRAFT_68830 [Hyaloscypha finlandica]|nr:hypothetical protein BGZ57DRAFT_68830 [Hyaloscypha finlandica]